MMSKQIISEERRREAQAIIEEAQAKKGLITVLTCRLEQYDDPVAKVAVAELRNYWCRFLRDHYRRRTIARRRREHKERGW